MSTGKRTSASGCLSAISSMSMPPSAENSSSGPLLAGSLSTAAYISRAIGTCASTSTAATRCSPIVMPRMLPAAALARRASAASLMPPALPRLPVGTCALTTHGPIARAAASASSGVRASAPSGVAMPAARNSGLAACSSKLRRSAPRAPVESRWRAQHRGPGSAHRSMARTGNLEPRGPASVAAVRRSTHASRPRSRGCQLTTQRLSRCAGHAGRFAHFPYFAQ